jgi:hypothetical protein
MRADRVTALPLYFLIPRGVECADPSPKCVLNDCKMRRIFLGHFSAVNTYIALNMY